MAMKQKVGNFHIYRSGTSWSAHYEPVDDSDTRRLKPCPHCALEAHVDSMYSAIRGWNTRRDNP